jgi:hypothetical protein
MSVIGIFQMAITTFKFPFHDPLKYTQIGNFNVKVYPLATLYLKTVAHKTKQNLTSCAPTTSCSSWSLPPMRLGKKLYLGTIFGSPQISLKTIDISKVCGLINLCF